MSLSVNNQNSYQASSTSSLNDLRFPNAQEQATQEAGSVTLDTNFGSQATLVKENHLQLTEGFQQLTFSARTFVQSQAA